MSEFMSTGHETGPVLPIEPIALSARFELTRRRTVTWPLCVPTISHRAVLYPFRITYNNAIPRNKEISLVYLQYQKKYCYFVSKGSKQ